VLLLSCKNEAEAIVILMEQKKGGANYKVGLQSFTSERLYDYLSKSIIKNGEKNSAILIAHESISIADIINMRGVLQKIGFKSIRYFYYDDDKRMMAEFSFGKAAIPFSVDPEAL
jgi:hypothetical protein